MIFILPKYQIFLQEKWQEILENHLPIEVEYKIRTASGDIKWVWERGSGIFNEDGTLSHLEGFITDITERKQAEEKLENTQKKLLNIFKAAEKCFVHSYRHIRNITSNFRIQSWCRENIRL